MGQLSGDTMGTSAHSIFMSLSMASYSGSREWLLNFGQSGSYAEHWLWNGDSSIQFGEWNGNQISSADITSATTLATTYDGSTYSLYIDGVLSSSISTSNFAISDNEIDVVHA